MKRGNQQLKYPIKINKKCIVLEKQEALEIHLRHSVPNQSPSHPYQALPTHPWSPHYSLALCFHSRPSRSVPGPATLIPTNSHPSQALHSVHTHLRPFTPVPGSYHPPKALHNNLRPSTPTQSPLHPSKAFEHHPLINQ